MRICMLSYSFYDNDPRIQQYARALVERGDAVDVIALKRAGQASQEVIQGVNVSRIEVRRRDERGPLDHAFRVLKFLIHSAWVIARKQMADCYQLVHVHSVPDFLVFAAIVPRLAGTPVILDIHDILPEFYASKFKVGTNSRFFKFVVYIERLSAKFSSHIIVANHIWHERLLSRSVCAEKCTAIRNYPSPEFSVPYPKTRTDGKFVIMYPGTLNWHQGLDIAIKAFAIIKDRVPEAEFHIYGEGSARPALIDLARKLGLNGKVIFRDFLPLKEIAPIMANADLALVAKRATIFGDEAVSTKVLEFMALGVPVLKTRTRVGTYYHDESRVKFFESENVQDLAECILLLRRDQQLRNRLVLNATKYVQENNWEIRKVEYLRLVDSLVATQNRGKRQD